MLGSGSDKQFTFQKKVFLFKKIFSESGNDVGNGGSGVSFGFSYVQHPQPVVGFEWRKFPRYMSRLFITQFRLLISTVTKWAHYL